MAQLRRGLRAAVAAGFAAGTLAPLPALAQDAAPLPALTAPGAAAPNAADPPARVGRVASITGTVSFHGPQAEDWQPATPNYPLTAGDALWTEPQAGAVAEVSDSRFTLAPETEFDVDVLDPLAMTATEPRGEVFLDLRDLAPGETYTVLTPRARLTLAQAGQYEIAAGDTTAPTTVTVLAGAAQADGDNLNVAVQPGQTLTITGDTAFTGTLGPMQRDSFLVALLNQQQPPPPQPEAAPPPQAVAQMPGAEDLQAYGTWQQAPQYGSVWYPQVAAGWVPYREGHWAYVAPWGWTWVDNAPWGFAPFHYGRWVSIGGRWGWSPAYGGAPAAAFARPVYAPALVTFLGAGVGAAIGLGAAAAVGWVPLGWNEPFHPYYHASPAYLRNVNRGYVANVNAIGRAPSGHFANFRAATAVPAAAMAGSRPIAAVARPVPQQRLASLRPAATVPVRPTRATAGVTPALARQLRLPAGPAGPAVAPRHAAPGPALAQQATRPVPGQRRMPALQPTHGPAVHPAAAPMAPHPAETPQHRPEAPAPRPEAHPAAAVPQHRPEAPAPRPEAHPAPQHRPEPERPESHPAAARPPAHPAPHPAGEAHPQPERHCSPDQHC